MEWNHFTVGALMAIIGVVVYMAAGDFITSLPGNFLFFGGVIAMTWGSEHEVAKAFQVMAILSLVFIVSVVGHMLYRARKQSSPQPE